MIAPTWMIHPKEEKKRIRKGKAVVGVLPCLAEKIDNQYQFQYQANYYRALGLLLIHLLPWILFCCTALLQGSLLLLI